MAQRGNADPSASGFDPLAPKSPHSSAPAPPDRNPGRGAALARTRKRGAKGKRGPAGFNYSPFHIERTSAEQLIPSASGFDRLVPKQSPYLRAGEPPAEAPPSRARGNAHPRGNAATLLGRLGCSLGSSESLRSSKTLRFFSRTRSVRSASSVSKPAALRRCNKALLFPDNPSSLHDKAPRLVKRVIVGRHTCTNSS